MDRFSASRFRKTHPIDLYLNGHGKNKDDDDNDDNNELNKTTGQIPEVLSPEETKDDNMDNVGGKRGVPWPPKQHWTEVVKYIGTKFNLKWNEALKKWKELGKPNPTTEIKEPKKEKPKKEKPKKEEIKKQEPEKLSYIFSSHDIQPEFNKDFMKSRFVNMPHDRQMLDMKEEEPKKEKPKKEKPKRRNKKRRKEETKTNKRV